MYIMSKTGLKREILDKFYTSKDVVNIVFSFKDPSSFQK